VRDISSADNLIAQVEGDIEEVDGVLRITRIRLAYQIHLPPGKRTEAERALAVYADKCPAYQSVKDCIACSWTAEFIEDE